MMYISILKTILTFLSDKKETTEIKSYLILEDDTSILRKPFPFKEVL